MVERHNANRKTAARYRSWRQRCIQPRERSNETDFPKRATRDFTGVNSNRVEPSIGARSRQDKWPCARSTSKPALFSQLCGVSIDPSVHLSPRTTWLMDHTRTVRAFARLPPDYRSSSTADLARPEIWYQSAPSKRGSLALSRIIIIYHHSRKEWEDILMSSCFGNVFITRYGNFYKIEFFI